ncbi:MAG: hypothetical protein MRJ92_04155 [Nitrospira sp.]|nr:hypothetical protein [Nitrospira sp.]
MIRYLSVPVCTKIRCSWLIGLCGSLGPAGDHVQIYSRRGGPLYLQRVPSGLITGVTFRYVGSDQHSAMNLLDSVCTVTQCRATEGVLSGVVTPYPEARTRTCRQRDLLQPGVRHFCICGRPKPYRPTTSVSATIILD